MEVLLHIMLYINFDKVLKVYISVHRYVVTCLHSRESFVLDELSSLF